jgi:hypothetical protein
MFASNFWGRSQTAHFSDRLSDGKWGTLFRMGKRASRGADRQLIYQYIYLVTLSLSYILVLISV